MTTNTQDPPDGGWGWLCVLGKLYCYFITLGLTSAFGVIYVELIDYFNSTREEAAWIGSLSLGLTLMTGPLSSILTSRFGLRKTTALGTLIAFSGCLISCFANGIPYLYVSYGVVMGLGLGLTLVPCTIIVLQYFKARLGLANAIGSAGNGIATLVLPPLYTYLLEEYGWRGTLMLLSGIVLNGLVCAFIFIPPPYLKARVLMIYQRFNPPCHNYQQNVWNDGSHASVLKGNTTKPNFCRSFHSFLTKPLTLLYLIGLLFGLFGYSIPFLHLPDMAMQIGIDKYQAAYLVSIMGIAGIIGRIVFGLISDLPSVNVIFLQGFSALMCAASTAVCPHLTEFYAQAVYSAIYGIFIGAFVSIVGLVGLELVGLEGSGDFMGSALFVSGAVNTMASPLAGWLFDLTKTYNASLYFASCAFALGGVLITLVGSLHIRKKASYVIQVKTVTQSYTDTHL